MFGTIFNYILLWISIGVCSSAPFDDDIFVCDNNKTISADNLCDNTDDCSDRSDEKPSICIQYPRDPKYFYCSYGPQLDNDLVCNGTPDCLDGSDEYYHFCQYYRATKDQQVAMNEKLHGNCSTEEFDCQSNKCIDWGETCDGHPDCPNGLDETPEICMRDNIQCVTYQYKCAYGACIHVNLICNGINDCVDGSDEAINRENCSLNELIKGPTMTNLIVPKYDNYCHVPPKSGMKVINGHKDDIKIFHNITYVTLDTAVKFECNDGYNVSNTDLSKTYFACGENNKWSQTIPKCERKCKALKYDETVKVVCSKGNCLSPLAGDIAYINCELGYRLTNKTRQLSRLTCQENGEWSDNFDTDLTKNVCEQTCGIVEKPREAFSSRGVIVRTYQMPWHIALYSREDPRRLTYLCSGSLLSAVWVLTAAHCIVDVYNQAIIPNALRAIANKQYREIDIKNTEPSSEIQTKEVIEVYAHDEYKDFMRSYSYDVGLVKVKDRFIFNTRVSPVCGPTEEMLKESDLLSSEVATCGVYDSISKSISVLFGQVSNSSTNTHANFHIDNHGVIEKGDSGGGVFIERHDKKYIRGIISNGYEGPTQSFVSISDMYNRELVNWIRSKVLEF